MILANALWDVLWFITADILAVVVIWQAHKTIRHWIRTGFRVLRKRGDMEIERAGYYHRERRRLPKGE